MVYAGPGSGKTTVITWRALHLCQVHQIDPKKIVIFTFTRRSAQELKQRLMKREPRLASVVAGTFHSLFLRFLLRFLSIDFTIWNERQQTAAVREVLRTLSMPTFDDSVRRLLQAITQLKNAFIAPDQLRVQDPFHQDVKRVYEAYEQLKAAHHAYDYDDVLLAFYRSMQESREFLQGVTSSFSHIMVDEFQDTSKVQWLALRKMVSQQPNVLVVGDDDQSIYRFRGALPHIISQFTETYEGCPEVILRHNFRSTDEIIRLSSKLISNNAVRKPKEFMGTRGSGVKVRFFSFASEWDEAKYLARLIKKIAEKEPTVTIAVLARTNRQLNPMIDVLSEHKLFKNIVVTTFHGAKGLEFDDVFLIGLHDEALPHARTL